MRDQETLRAQSLRLLHEITAYQLQTQCALLCEELERLEKRYNPHQPRVPRGHSDGGQWTRVGGMGEATLPGGEGNDDLRSRQRGRGTVPRSWARRDEFERHYKDHAKDFGAKTPESYAEKAQKFRRYAENRKLPQIRTADGYVKYYDPKTNTFGTYHPNGRTETFYKPGAGERYFDNKVKEEIARGGKVTNYPWPGSRGRSRGGGGAGGGSLWKPGDLTPNPLDDLIIY
jgi:hypothetical protein